MEDIFKSIFEGDNITVISFLVCIIVSLLCGVGYFFAYSFKERNNKNLRFSIILLPTIVSVIIMMVNGNLGIGVAIAGAFTLVRFRSIQCSAKEICIIFTTMCTGLIIGVGFIAFGFLFTFIICLIMIVLNLIFTIKDQKSLNRSLKIIIPEDLDYEEVFLDIFEEFTSFYSLNSVKTSNMGTLYKLKYDITLKKDINEKEFIDSLRIRNGNLDISLNRYSESEY